MEIPKTARHAEINLIKDIKRDTIGSTSGEPSAERENVDRDRWLHAARSRLRFELLGLAFALSRGATPQEYARFLWSKGAVRWMGIEIPDADNYLLKEIAAVGTLFPWVKVTHGRMASGQGEITFSGGCLGGYGEDRWALAEKLGLDQTTVCEYCAEAFKVWGRQLALTVTPFPGNKGTCRLRATKANTTNELHLEVKEV